MNATRKGNATDVFSCPERPITATFLFKNHSSFRKRSCRLLYIWFFPLCFLNGCLGQAFLKCSWYTRLPYGQLFLWSLKEEDTASVCKVTVLSLSNIYTFILSLLTRFPVLAIHPNPRKCTIRKIYPHKNPDSGLHRQL